MHLSILKDWHKAESGETLLPDREDAFAFPAYEGDDAARGFWKQLSYAVLNGERRFNNWPTGLKDQAPSPFMDLPEALDILFRELPLVEHYAFTGIGLKLMKSESDVLILSLKELMSRNIGFLPMHDGIMVPETASSIARTAMQEAYKKVVGSVPIVTEKPVMKVAPPPLQNQQFDLDKIVALPPSDNPYDF
jgi:hypothetical protein